MPLTEAQKRAQENYRKKSIKQIAVRFYPGDTELWAWLQSQENRQGYIRDLIRADMEGRREFWRSVDLTGNQTPRKGDTWPM